MPAIKTVMTLIIRVEKSTWMVIEPQIQQPWMVETMLLWMLFCHKKRLTRHPHQRLSKSFGFQPAYRQIHRCTTLNNLIIHRFKKLFVKCILKSNTWLDTLCFKAGPCLNGACGGLLFSKKPVLLEIFQKSFRLRFFPQEAGYVERTYINKTIKKLRLEAGSEISCALYRSDVCCIYT